MNRVFDLKITMPEDQMSTMDQVADVLQSLAAELRGTETVYSGRVMYGGNTEVGHFRFGVENRESAAMLMREQSARRDAEYNRLRRSGLRRALGLPAEDENEGGKA